MLRWSIEPIQLPLKYTWKISRNASDSKTNFIVTVTDGLHSGRGEAAPNIRYDETPERITEEFHSIHSRLPAEPLTAESCSKLLDEFQLRQSLRFALESAYIHYLCDCDEVSPHRFLDLDASPILHTAYTIPILDAADMKKFYDEQRLSRFRYIKLKIGADTPADIIHYLRSFCPQPLIIDANEAFTDPDKCIAWMEKIGSERILFIEQPMPASCKMESIYLKKNTSFLLFADETVTNDPDFDFLPQAFDGVNMKLMKAGGYLNGLRILKEARRRRMKTMIGCMVETTLGISSAMHLASLADFIDLDSFLLLTHEPFGMVREENGVLFQEKAQPAKSS
jgi:L-alanine-DL-glutamate epimerase-like enolase superfamily enzyme